MLKRWSGLFVAAMVAAFVLGTAYVLTPLLAAAGRPAAQGCTPGTPTTEQYARRLQAVQFARRINTAESNAFAAGHAYLPLATLADVGTPDGFSVQLAVDGSGYVFGIKDTRDPCKFALFSDQDGLIYTAQPLQ
jgi:hypothetical protein